jgi:predicted phosphodiesterase
VSSLGDELRGPQSFRNYPQAEDLAPAERSSIEFTGTSAIIDRVQISDEPGQPPEYEDLLRKWGRDPERFRLADIIYEKHWEVPYRPLMRDDAGNPVYDGNGKVVYEEQQMRWAASYKVRVDEVNGIASSADLEAIVLRARADRSSATGPYWGVFQAGDTQLGKRSRDGGTDQIIERYIKSVDEAKAEFARLRKSHGIEGIQISLPGDCIEGNQSQSGRNMGYLTTETVPEQVLILQRLMLYTIEQFAPLAERVFLDTVNGNHDQSQRQLNTWAGDGWATHAAATVADALKMNPLAFKHVEVRVPEKWSGSLVVPVGDTVVCVVHGHQWRQWYKAITWWSEQAVHNQPATQAQVLQHGHFHTWRHETHKSRTIVCSSTLDCGSDYYRDEHGAEAARGALVYLLNDGRVSRMSLV